MSATPAFRNDRPINALCLALAAALFAALAAFSAWLWQAGRAPLLLAPAVGGLHNCRIKTEILYFSSYYFL